MVKRIVSRSWRRSPHRESIYREGKKFWQKICIQIFVFTVRVKGNSKVFRRSIRWQGWNISIYILLGAFSSIFQSFPMEVSNAFNAIASKFMSHNRIYIYIRYIVRRTFISTSQVEIRCTIRFRFRDFISTFIYITLYK